MGDFIDTLGDNWTVIQQAPLAYLITCLVIFAVLWKVISHIKREQFEALEGRLKLRDDEIANYKRQLEGASPDEAKARIEALEKKLAALKPKELSPKQIEAITKVARRSPASVIIGHDIGYSDGKKLSVQLQHAFREAGWEVSSAMIGGPSFMPPSGVSVAVSPERERTEGEKALLAALANANIAYAIHPRKKGRRETGEIEIALTQPADD